MMQQLTERLEFFRDKYKKSLEYDGSYLAGMGDEIIDFRSEDADVWNGVIAVEIVVGYLGYRSTMDNFQSGLERTKEEIEKMLMRLEMSIMIGSCRRIR